MRYTALILLFAGVGALYAAEEQSREEQQRDTIRYGTETEINTLIQILKQENVAYLDNELVQLMQTTKNPSLMTNIWSLFGSRSQTGLEDHAIQVINGWQDNVQTVVLSAIDYLGAVQAEQAVAPLKTLLDAEEQRFSTAALRALGKIGKAGSTVAEDTAAYLMNYYTAKELPDESKQTIISALGGTGSPTTIDFLKTIAQDDASRAPLRIAALESLAQVGDSTALDAVMLAVHASDPTVRSTAIASLAPFSGPEVDSIILESFRDSYYKTRVAAAQATGERKLLSAIPYLRYRAEHDEVPAVKDEALRALGAIGTSETVAILESLFSNRKNTERVRFLAAEMLLKNDAAQYGSAVIAELDQAKRANFTSLYTGFRRVLVQAVTPVVEELAQRFLSSGTVEEKSMGLDMVVNNNFVALIPLIQELSTDKNGSLARKAQSTLEKLGQTVPQQPTVETVGTAAVEINKESLAAAVDAAAGIEEIENVENIENVEEIEKIEEVDNESPVEGSEPPLE